MLGASFDHLFHWQIEKLLGLNTGGPRKDVRIRLCCSQLLREDGGRHKMETRRGTV